MLSTLFMLKVSEMKENASFIEASHQKRVWVSEAKKLVSPKAVQ